MKKKLKIININFKKLWFLIKYLSKILIYKSMLKQNYL